MLKSGDPAPDFTVGSWSATRRAKGEILSTYDVRVPVLGLARRVTFVIGKDRRIEGVHESAFDPLSHVARACKLVLKRADGAPSP